MRLFFMSVICFFVVVSISDAKPRFIKINEELENASLIVFAKIVVYTENGLEIQPLNQNASKKIVKYSTDPQWNPKRFVGEKPQDLMSTDLTAYWPPEGEDVLIVIDQDGAVSLFAWKIDDNYRFWSPHMTGSFALFECQEPAQPLPNTTPVEWLERSSWDGCLMPDSAIKLTENEQN